MSYFHRRLLPRHPLKSLPVMHKSCEILGYDATDSVKLNTDYAVSEHSTVLPIADVASQMQKMTVNNVMKPTDAIDKQANVPEKPPNEPQKDIAEKANESNVTIPKAISSSNGSMKSTAPNINGPIFLRKHLLAAATGAPTQETNSKAVLKPSTIEVKEKMEVFVVYVEDHRTVFIIPCAKDGDLARLKEEVISFKYNYIWFHKTKIQQMTNK